VFLFENMPTIKTIHVVEAEAVGNAEAFPGSDVARSQAIRGVPTIHFW
jgi:hypothetical protein